jgi:hypothetical protein
LEIGFVQTLFYQKFFLAGDQRQGTNVSVRRMPKKPKALFPNRFRRRQPRDLSTTALLIGVKRGVIAGGVGCAGLDGAREVVEDGADNKQRDEYVGGAAQFVKLAC